MSDDLIAFLKARLDEDEHQASGLAGATRFVDGRPDFYGVGGPAADAYWEHFPPHRILHEVEAKRTIIREAREMLGIAFSGEAGEGLAIVALHQMASVYSDHPDYRAEWKP